MPEKAKCILPFGCALQKLVGLMPVLTFPSRIGAMPTSVFPPLVGVDAYIAPANRTDFSGIFGEFDTSQWVDVSIDPYGENGRPIKIYKPAI